MRMHKISQCNDFKAALLYRFLPQATKSGTDSGSEGGTFRDHVMDAVELFESRKVWLRLIQRGHGAGDDHGVRMAALTGQHRHSADGLKNQIYRAGGQIGGGGVLREITEVGSGHVGVQRGGRVPGNVADGEIHMAQIPLERPAF